MSTHSIFKKTLNHIGIFISGVTISSGFVLSTNDMFYNLVFRRLLVENDNTEESSKNIWREIKPREIFGKGAKSTFLKHQIEEERDDEQRRYHSYLEERRRLEESGVDENKKIFENIFEKKNK